MGVLFARYTDANYIGLEGKILLANRVYMAPDATPYLNPAAPVNDAAPTPTATWTDLGSIMRSKVQITIPEPEIVDVETGLFRVLRGQVGIRAGRPTFNFRIVEYEPTIWNALTGRAITNIGSPPVNNAYQSIGIGGQAILSNSFLFVGQNAATGSEFHHYIQKGRLRYAVEEDNDFMVIHCTVTALFYSLGGQNVAYELKYYTRN